MIKWLTFGVWTQTAGIKSSLYSSLAVYHKQSVNVSASLFVKVG